MRYVEILRSGDTPMNFRGDLLASQSSRRVNGTEATRWHEIEVYRTDTGKYVIHLGCRSQWSGEPRQDVALIAGSIKDAQEAVRAAVPPLEALAGYPVGGYLEQRRLTLERDAMIRFDAAVSALFRQARVPRPSDARRATRRTSLPAQALAQ